MPWAGAATASLHFAHGGEGIAHRRFSHDLVRLLLCRLGAVAGPDGGLGAVEVDQVLLY